MKNIIYILVLIFSAAIVLKAQIPPAVNLKDFVKVEARPEKGFSYPYYLYVPPELRQPETQKRTHTILVLPNNTAGGVNDDFKVHEADVKKRMPQAAGVASLLKVSVLMPVFPRPGTDWRVLTHALDRDSITTENKDLARFDLQLIAMIDDARDRLKKDHLRFEKRVLINGFSASGMFANRFTFLHPVRVKAAAIGSPGGWPIAPASLYRGKALRYPIGTNDLKDIIGHKFDLKDLRKAPLFVYLGDRDENDSVPFGDGYEDVDREVIYSLFGKTPIDRWAISKLLYEQNGLNAQFKLYPNIKHTVAPEMRDDIMAFLKKYAR